MIPEHFSLIARKTQYVNLYAMLPQMQMVKLSLKRLLKWLGLLVICMIAISSYQSYQSHRLNNQVVELSKANTAATNDYNRLMRQFGIVDQENAALASEKAAKENAAKILASALIGRKQYSRYFDIFSNTISENVWLTDINIQGQQHSILLKGFGLNLKEILVFAEKLNKQKLFEDTPFRLTEITRPSDESEPYQFTLTTRG